MLNLENQVCSLELAKKLKSLNVKQESLFWWSDWYKEGSYSVGYQSLPQKIRKTEADGSFLDRITDRISAFTCAELGEMLPEEAATFSYREECYKSWMCKLHVKGDWSRYRKLTEASSMADAMGKMLIYLIENGLCPSPSKN